MIQTLREGLSGARALWAELRAEHGLLAGTAWTLALLVAVAVAAWKERR